MAILVNTKTRVTVSGSDLGIYTWYNQLVQGLGYLLFWINGTPRSVNGVRFIEGELGYTIENNPDFFFLNKNGDLIANTNNPTAYAIDADGNMTYTY